MATDTKPVVTRIQQVTNFSSTGQPQISYAVTFTTGDHGPFTLTIPEAEFNAKTVLERINKFAMTVYEVAPPAQA